MTNYQIRIQHVRPIYQDTPALPAGPVSITTADFFMALKALAEVLGMELTLGNLAFPSGISQLAEVSANIKGADGLLWPVKLFVQGASVANAHTATTAPAAPRDPKQGTLTIPPRPTPTPHDRAGVAPAETILSDTPNRPVAEWAEDAPAASGTQT